MEVTTPLHEAETTNPLQAQHPECISARGPKECFQKDQGVDLRGKQTGSSIHQLMGWSYGAEEQGLAFLLDKSGGSNLKHKVLKALVCFILGSKTFCHLTNGGQELQVINSAQKRGLFTLKARMI